MRLQERIILARVDITIRRINYLRNNGLIYFDDEGNMKWSKITKLKPKIQIFK